MSIVNSDYGNWIILDDEAGQHGILAAKDIVLFTETMAKISTAKTIGKARDYIIELSELVEFAPVDVQKNGIIRWRGGHFAGQK